MTHLEALDASLDRARIAELIGQGRYADAETAIRQYVRQVWHAIKHTRKGATDDQ